MRLRRIFPLLLALALLSAPAGCGSLPAPAHPAQSESEPDVSAPAPGPGQEAPALPPFTLAFYPDYSIHPALAANRANLALSPLLYEGLFTVDGAFQPVPVLCRSWSVSEDGLVWTFLLRQGVTFSDGTPLTGTLAARALNTALGRGSRYEGRISYLRSVTGTEEAVTVTLYQPNGALPALLDIPLALDDSGRPLGTGQYVLDEPAEGTPALHARSDWWAGQPAPVHTIRLFSIQQAGDLIAAFDSGDVTLLDVDLTGTNSLGYSGSYEVWDYSTSDLIYLGFNTKKGWCRDVNVRRAVSRGIDRQSIAQIPYASHAAASSLPVHPSSPLSDSELQAAAAYDPDFLARFLQSASLPAKPLVLLVNTENRAKVSTAEYVAYQLQAVGLEAEVKKLPWDDFTAALEKGEFDLYVGEVLLPADFDPSALLSSSGALNYGRWEDSRTDQLLYALRCAREEDRAPAARELWNRLEETAPIAPICFKNGSVLTQWGRLSGLRPVQNNAFFGLEGWVLDP